jgi:hypothetical protein
VIEGEQLFGEAVEVVIVRGRAMAVTAVAFVYQCADTATTARGRPTASLKARQAAV